MLLTCVPSQAQARLQRPLPVSLGSIRAQPATTTISSNMPEDLTPEIPSRDAFVFADATALPAHSGRPRYLGGSHAQPEVLRVLESTMYAPARIPKRRSADGEDSEVVDGIVEGPDDSSATFRNLLHSCHSKTCVPAVGPSRDVAAYRASGE